MQKRYLIPLIILFLTCISLFLIFNFLLNRKEDAIKSVLEIESAKSVGTLSERINQTFAIIDDMNHQIKNDPKNKQYINNILTKYKTNPNLVETFSWTIFSFADKSGKITVDATYGIMKNPFDLSSRDYIPLTKENPGIFYLGKPVIGSTSKKWMIPGGIGLADKNGDYVGTMTIGFEIDALARIIQKSLQNKNVKILLIYDQNNLPVLYANSKSYGSFQNQTANISDKKTNEVLDKLKSANNNQIIDISLVSNTHGYLAKKLENYPLTLVLEYDKNAIIDELWSSIISRIYEILFIIFAAAALLYLIYKREQEQFQKEFLRLKLHASNLRLKALNKSVNHDLRNYISGVLGLAQIIEQKTSEFESVNTGLPRQGVALPRNDDAEDSLSKLPTSSLRSEGAGYQSSFEQINVYAKMIEDQARIMLKFSSSLLTDEGIENKSNNLGILYKDNVAKDIEDIDLAKLVAELTQLKKPFLQEQQVSIKTNIEANLPTLKTNLIELRKILDNLITNAIKYSPKNSEILINVKLVDKNDKDLIATSALPPRNDGVFSLLSELSTPSLRATNGSAAIQKIYIEISDNGIGMTPDEIEKALSGEGKSIDKSGLDKPIDSHGIGMPIVKQAVENLGARMEIESEKGKGTKIKLWFDVGNKDWIATPSARNDDVEDSLPKLPTSSLRGATNGRDAAIHNGSSDKTILLADDSEVVLMTTKMQLTNLGFNVLTAKNGDEAITVLENNNCDFVLMDTNMESLGDGLKITKLIREGLIFKNFKNFKTIPIIAFSADSDSTSQKMAVESGANGCLEKPFDQVEFLKILNFISK